jgi:hypothetical protein
MPLYFDGKVIIIDNAAAVAITADFVEVDSLIGALLTLG